MLLSVFLIAACLATADDLIKLDVDNFDDVLQKEGILFVKFFAPWCGHCKRLAPTWEELAGTLEGIAVAELDCTAEPNEPICSKYNITGFPTLILIDKEGAVVRYEGARELEELKSWAIRMSGPASQEWSDDAREEEINFVLFGADEKTLGIWNNAMSKYKGHFGIFHTASKTFNGVTTNEAHIYIKKMKEDPIIEPFDAATLAETIEKNSKLLVAELSPRNFSKFASDKENLFWISFFDVEDEDTDKRIAELQDSSRKCGEGVNFTFIDGKAFKDFTKNFKQPEKMPFSVVLKSDEFAYFMKPEDQDACDFIADIQGGRIEAVKIKRDDSE